ncbi:MAG: GGDEF domain-containing protein [Deltaproteobacteria bacterium]|nr:GGDEF domain-containing protein [Deltaproteobacteria bacterium]
MDMQSDIATLQRENESLRREIARLEDLRALTYRDGLTGLWNRRYFAERLGSELSRARRAGRRPFTVLLLDVNDFHLINKTHGPGEGDLVLRWVAEFLEKSVRAHDVCCRIEADEFAVIVTEMSNSVSHRLLDRLRDKLATLSVRAPFSFGLSMGTASFPDQGTAFDVLMRVAEEARFEDKRRQASGPRTVPAEGQPGTGPADPTDPRGSGNT